MSAPIQNDGVARPAINLGGILRREHQGHNTAPEVDPRSVFI
jgi:hypothetical protein